jgi:hypothetical protein
VLARAPIAMEEPLAELALHADTTALLIGLEPEQASRYFRGCAVRAHLDNGVGLKNQEHGEPVSVCTGERGPWSQLWPKLRHYN